MSFEETETELRLGLPGSSEGEVTKKRGFDETIITTSYGILEYSNEKQPPPAPNKAAQVVVGWPPIRSHRKNSLALQIIKNRFVKVSLDGAPYLRKLDLSLFCTYTQLSQALAKLFPHYNNYVPVPTYQDKDGDWMLVGDVPWQMFLESCKRLRVMKGIKELIIGLDRTKDDHGIEVQDQLLQEDRVN